MPVNTQNLHIQVMNRAEAIRFSHHPYTGRKVAMVSIATPGEWYNSFPAKKNNVASLLNVEFFDVLNNKEGVPPITQDDATHIAKFILARVDQGCGDFIIHCDAGMSRSAGVAKAMEEFFELPGRNVTYRTNSFPNQTVYEAVLSALKAEADKQAEEKAAIERRAEAEFEYDATHPE